MQTLRSIQYLRAAAALAVVGYHILQWRRGGFEEGRAGVDVFFVISGVIMWRITSDRPTSPGAFLWRRFTRVVPTYWVATLLLAAIALAWPDFLPKVRPQWGHILLSLAFIPHFDPLNAPFPLLAPGWTLSYEATFYLIFAAGLLAPRRARAWLVAAALSAVVAAGFFLSDPAYILGANPMLLQFAAGVWIGKLSAEGRLPSGPWGVFLVAVGLAALAAMWLADWRNELWRPLLWGAPAAAIVCGALSLEARGWIGRSAILLRLGDASYALYLVHPLAVAAVAHALGGGRGPLFIPLSLAAAIGSGLAAHIWVEKPLIRVFRSAPLWIESLYRRDGFNRSDGKGGGS